MRLLITTRADKNIREMTKITHPIIKKFAKLWGADFYKLEKNADCEGNGKYHYRIFDHYSLFNKYDRILHLDSDILINVNCPNLFEIVPYHKIGTIFEDKGTREADRLERIKKAQDTFGDIGWKSGYINTGVFLTSKCHKKIYEKIDGNFWKGNGFDDVHLGYNINKYKLEICELPFQFNHMTLFSENWNGFPNRFESYIIHYAGRGVFEKKFKKKKNKYKAKIKQIKSDYRKINRKMKSFTSLA